MTRAVINNYIKKLLRTNDTNSLVGRVIFDVSKIVLIIYLFMFGLGFQKVAIIFWEQSDVFSLFSSMFCYWWAIGLVILFYWQKKWTEDFLPYLNLPIKKVKISLFILVFSTLNFLTIGFLLFGVPFGIINVLPNHGTGAFILFTLFIVLSLVLLSQLVFLIRCLCELNSVFNLLPIGVAIVTFYAWTIQNETISLKSITFFKDLLNGNLIIFGLTIVFLVTIFLVNLLMLKTLYYKIYSQKNSRFDRPISSERITTDKQYMLFFLYEPKLIFRNRRLRYFFIIWIGMFFAFYYLVFRGINGQFPSFFIFLIVTGMYGYLFAQYLFSWESSFFDLLSTIRFDLRKYIEAKLIIYVFVSVITSLLFVPLIIKGKVDLKVFFSALLYNSGFGYFIVFLLSTYNSAKIELNKGIFGNYEGFSLVQFAAVFIVLLLPYSVIFLFRNIISFSSCLLMINMLSILSIINSRKWFDLIVKRFMMRRYFNLSGYRK